MPRRLLLLGLALTCVGAALFPSDPISLAALRSVLASQAAPPYIPPCPIPYTPVPLPQNGSLPQSIADALHVMDQFWTNYIVNPQFSLTEQKTLGISVGVTYDNVLLFEKGYGSAKISQPGIPPSPTDTLFMIGSVTKVINMLAVLILEERGLVHLDDPVSKYLPKLRINDPFSGSTTPVFTFRQALGMLAGLPRADPCEFECNESLDTMFARIANLTTWYPVNTWPSYSNLGHSLVGHAVEAIAGVSFEEFVVTNIFTPLHMRNSGITLTPSVRSRMATGYFGFNPGVPVNITELGWGTPSGGVYSTAHDMSLLLAALNTGTGLFSSPLSYRTALSLLFQDTDGLSAYGMPFVSGIFPGTGVRMLAKGGAVPGFYSEVALIPEYKIGFVVLYNYYDEAINSLIDTYAVLGSLLPAFVSFFAAAVQGLPVPPIPTLFTGTYTQHRGQPDSQSFTVTLNTTALGPQLMFYSGGSLQGALAASPASPSTLIFHQLVPGMANQAPCLQLHLAALERMPLLFTGDGAAHMTGFYWGDVYSQDPYLFQS